MSTSTLASRLLYIQSRLELVVRLKTHMLAAAMFALGETAILPGLVLIVVLFPATIWTLTASVKGKRNAVMAICALIATLFGGWGTASGLKSLVVEWPPEGDLIFGLIFCAFFFFAGVFSLVKMWKAKRRDQASEKAKVPTL